MTEAILIVGCIIGYIVVACVIYGVLLYLEKWDEEMTAGIIFWPICLPIVLAVGSVVIVSRLSVSTVERVVKRIGAARLDRQIDYKRTCSPQSERRSEHENYQIGGWR